MIMILMMKVLMIIIVGLIFLKIHTSIIVGHIISGEKVGLMQNVMMNIRGE